MPSLASITLNDGQATPVAHVFAPVTTDGSYARLAERLGSPVGFPTLSTMVRPPVNNGKGVYRVRFTCNVPVTTTDVSGQTVKDHENSFSVEFLISENSTAQERKDILAYCKNLMSNAIATNLVVDLEPQY